jgi:hypothetical protein
MPRPVRYTYPSVEWLTASVDVVVRASVAGLAFKDREPPKGEAASQTQWVTVTLTVHATLKGKAPATIAFVIEQPHDSKALPAWKESGQHALWFLVDSGDGKEALRRDAPPAPPNKLRPRDRRPQFPGTAAVELAAPRKGKRASQPPWSMALRKLESEDAILAAVKDALALRGVRAMEIPLPRTVAGIGNWRDSHFLIVPVCDRLEQLGRGWARSKEQWIRESSIRALGPFRSEANTAVLKRLLGDESFTLRELAYSLLLEWKIAVPRPMEAIQ